MADENGASFTAASATRTRLVALASIAIAAVITASAALHLIAGWNARRNTESGLVWAQRLDPWNADRDYQLARYYAEHEQDWSRALPLLERAAAKNPYRSAYWI